MLDMKIITIDGTVWPVLGTITETLAKGEKLLKDKAYVADNDRVYIYGGKLKDNKPEKGYFYKVDGEYQYFEPKNPLDNEAGNMLDIDNIKEAICNADRMKNIEEELEIDKSDIDTFSPPIKETDDPLKRLVKMVLAELQVNLKHFRSEFSKEYDLTNIKASVTKAAPMTMKYFLRWAELLDLEVEITVRSKGEKRRVRRLKEDVTINIQ